LQQLDEQCMPLAHHQWVPHNFQPLQINKSASFNQIPRWGIFNPDSEHTNNFMRQFSLFIKKTTSFVSLLNKSHIPTYSTRWQQVLLLISIINFCWLVGGGGCQRITPIFFWRLLPKKWNNNVKNATSTVKFILDYMSDCRKRRKAVHIQETNYSPKHSWYSGSCLTVVTWRLSGSRQLQRTPDISTNS